MTRVLGFLIRYFSNYYTLHRSDIELHELHLWIRACSYTHFIIKIKINQINFKLIPTYRRTSFAYRPCGIFLIPLSFDGSGFSLEVAVFLKGSVRVRFFHYGAKNRVMQVCTKHFENESYNHCRGSIFFPSCSFLSCWISPF